MKEKICKICGRVYKREKCEYCQRLAEWEKKSLESKSIEGFTHRMLKELGMYNWDESVLFTESFFIFGPSGTGKTLYAAKQLLLIKQKLWVEKNYKKMAFITVTDLLKEFRKTYQKDSKLQESDTFLKYRILVI